MSGQTCALVVGAGVLIALLVAFLRISAADYGWAATLSDVALSVAVTGLVVVSIGLVIYGLTGDAL